LTFFARALQLNYTIQYSDLNRGAIRDRIKNRWSQKAPSQSSFIGHTGKLVWAIVRLSLAGSFVFLQSQIEPGQ